MDYAPGSPLGAAAHERFFIECDTHGRILWMNDRARARLGRLESLLEALPPSDLSALFKLLDPEPIAPWPAMASSLRCYTAMIDYTASNLYGKQYCFIGLLKGVKKNAKNRVASDA